MKPLRDFSGKELDRLEENANRMLSVGKENQRKEASGLLEMIAEERLNRSSSRIKNSAGIVWDNGNRAHRIAHLDGKVVAEIKKDENHNLENDEVYSIFVDGDRLNRRFRYVADARKEVEKMLKEQTSHFHHTETI